MKNTTPMFQGFHLRTLRRKPQFAQQILAKEVALLKQKYFKQVGVRIPDQTVPPIPIQSRPPIPEQSVPLIPVQSVPFFY